VYGELERYVQEVLPGLEALPDARKDALDDVASFVSNTRSGGATAELVFVCTHNSRRSQMAQLWAAAAAVHFDVDRARAYSGGTEVTAFNCRAVAALDRAGFTVLNPGGQNPCYRFSFAEDGPATVCFSKKWDDPSNPKSGFAAIMTCSDADEACPVIPGAALRAPVRYDDPKISDDTPGEKMAYDERCRQIATEMLYLFSRVA
jgi:arsenate reductase